MAGPIIIDPPPYAPPRVSLMSAAASVGVVGPPAGTDEHWRQAGVTFRRRLCSDPVTTWEICAPNEAEPDAKDIDTDAEGVKVWKPTLAWIGDRCTALQWTSEDTAARAREALEMKTSKYIANELWTGASSTAQGLGNDFLANPATVTDLTPVSGTSPLVYALNLLQNALHDQAGRGMIHATSATVNLWISSYVVRREGNVLLDWFDNIVVADDGYDGSDPDGNIDATGETAWAYATGVVPVWAGPIVTIPSENDLAAALDRSLNTIEWRVERPTLAMFDGCVHVGINVDLCSPCCVPEVE